jgi:hypothetical protein
MSQIAPFLLPRFAHRGLLAPLLCDAPVIAGQDSRVNGDKCWPTIFFEDQYWPMNYYVICINLEEVCNNVSVSC